MKLQMENDCKATEIEHLQMKLNETASLSSADNDPTEDGQDTIFEGYLHVPNKQNIRRHGWKKQYVVVSSRRIIFYNSEQDKQNRDSNLILDLRWVENIRLTSTLTNDYANIIAKYSTSVLWRKATSFVPMPKRFQESSSFSMQAKVKPVGLMSRTSTYPWGIKMTWGREIRFSKVMSLYRLAITCRRHARFVRSHYGICSGHQLHLNAKGKIFFIQLNFY